jgi:crossover junction endodeoxyribonuclease RuvC
MIVLGIDPGTLHLGWGVVFGEGNRISHLAHGVIDAPASQPLAQRLVHLDRCLNEVIAQHRPSVGSVESLFFHKDAQAASKLGHARGVVLLNLARAGIEVMEYPPARVKSTVTGHGRADKQQMVRMVGMLLGLGSDLREDAADALALAVTYLRRAPVERALAQTTRRPAVLRPSAKVVLRPSAK